MPRFLLQILSLLGLVFWLIISPSTVYAQAETLVVGAVVGELKSALKQFDDTLKTAGGEVRATGNSLQANAQNTLADIDKMLGSKMQSSFDRLNQQEQQLINDALLLTRQMKSASEAIVHKSSAEARRAIADGDITAYNASYSLPCRNQVPRVLYTWPETVRIGVDDPEFRIRGNFLDIGPEPPISVDGRVARLISRSRNEMTVRIPDEVLNSLTASQSLRVEIPAHQMERSGWLAGLICREELKPVSPVLTTAISIKPVTSYSVEGTIAADYAANDPHDFSFKGYEEDQNCEASRDWPQQYCIPSEYKLSGPRYFDIAVHSANCNSTVGTPQPSGDRCVLVPAHIGGCGVDRIPLPLLGGIQVNCRGRGWVDYTLVIHGVKPIRTTLPNSTFQGNSPNGSQSSFIFAHPSANQALPDIQWRYNLKVTVTNGGNSRLYALGNGNPNDGPVRTRLHSGTVYVTIQDY